MTDASKFGTSRCILHDGSDTPRVEIVLDFELLADPDTQWEIDYRDAGVLQFRGRGFLPTKQLLTFAAELKDAIDEKQGEVLLIDYEHAVRGTFHVLDAKSFLSLELRSERHLDSAGWNGFRFSVAIDRLPLEDGGLRKLYEWVRDWTQLLQPGV